MVSLGHGHPPAEEPITVIPAPREFRDDATGHASVNEKGQPIPADPLTDTDLALIRLCPESAQRALEGGKVFVEWTETSRLAVGEDIHFRGYAAKDVDLIPGPSPLSAGPHLVGDGYTLFSDVTDVQGTRVIVDSEEARVFCGSGTTSSARDLHGISGAGVFNEAGQLAALVYGGEPHDSTIFACPIEHLLPLLAASEQAS